MSTIAIVESSFVPSSSSAEPSAIATDTEGVPDLTETGYDCVRYMGPCNGGHVYLGKEKKNLKDFVAIKKFLIDDIDDYTLISTEVSNLRQMRHQNILELMKCFVYDNSIWMISQVMNLGSLYDIVFNYKKCGISERAAAGITHQVLDALDYLHSRRYIHRDLKPKHILLDSSGNVKLTGFRFMIELNRHLDCVFEFNTNFQNQIYYLAPEVLAQNLHGYTSKSDIYMLGITICEAINGVIPFAELDPLEMLHRKLNGQVPRPVDATSLKDDEALGIDISQRPREHLTRTFSPEMHDFIANCLTYEPHLRNSAIDLKDSPWLGTKANKSLRPIDISEALELDYTHFDLSLWEQQPVLPTEPEQQYDITFDYSPIS